MNISVLIEFAVEMSDGIPQPEQLNIK